MILSLKDFNEYLNWKGAEIHYFKMAGNTIHLDVYFNTFHQNKRCKFDDRYSDIRTHIIFKDVTMFTDDYYSSLEKLLSRFDGVYKCTSNRINESDELIIDDCIRLKCAEVELIELAHATN